MGTFSNCVSFVLTKELVYIRKFFNLYRKEFFSEYIVFHNMATTDVRYRGSVKGQLISKCPFGVIVLIKIPTKVF